MANIKRPKSLILIALILIIFSLYCFANAMLEPGFRVASASRILLLLWLIVSGILGLVSGFAILKGYNWGRLLCLYYMPLSIISYILTLLVYSIKFEVVLLISVVAVVFYIATFISLMRPMSLAFFTHSGSKE